MPFEPNIPKSVRREITRAVDDALAVAETDSSQRPSDDAHLRAVAEMFHVDPDEMVAYVLKRRRHASLS
jgi:fructose-1,6-bisphosphatase/sedoheptulose 1,7-bisphosphatase-like protein